MTKKRMSTEMINIGFEQRLDRPYELEWVEETVLGIAGMVWRLWKTWRTREMDIEHLRELDDHMLRDIGISRDQIERYVKTGR